MVPPDSIPNSEVKRSNADGSVGFPHVRVGHHQGFIKVNKPQVRDSLRFFAFGHSRRQGELEKLEKRNLGEMRKKRTRGKAKRESRTEVTSGPNPRIFCKIVRYTFDFR